MQNFLLSLILLLFSFTSFSQEWKKYYDSAVILQNNNDTNAIKFYDYAKTALPRDSLKSNINAEIAYNTAYIYQIQKKYIKAEPFYVEAKNIWEKIIGKDDYYASTLNNLASLYYSLKQYDKAESLIVEIKNIREKNLGKTILTTLLH